MARVDRATGNLALHDLTTGADRRLTETGTYQFCCTGQHQIDFAAESAISPDGKLIAYSWFTEAKGRYELRLLRLDGAGPSLPKTIFDNPDVQWIAPFDWSPDGKSLAVRVGRKDDTNQIGLIDTAKGSLTVLKTIDWRGAGKLAFSPDGAFVAYDLPPSDTSNRHDIFVLGIDGSKEIHAVAHPASDFVVGWSPDGRALLFASDRTGSTSLWSTLRAFIQRDLGSGRERELLRGEALFGFRLSPDGRQLTFIEPNPATKSQALKVLSVDSGQTREVFRVADPGTLTNLLEWTPDGRRLLFGQSEGKKESAWVIPVAGGVPVKLDLQLRDGPNDPYRAARIHPDGHRVLLTAGSPSSSEVWTLENFLPPAATARK